MQRKQDGKVDLEMEEYKSLAVIMTAVSIESKSMPHIYIERIREIPS